VLILKRSLIPWQRGAALFGDFVASSVGVDVRIGAFVTETPMPGGGGMTLFNANSEPTGRRAETTLIQALLPVRTELRGIHDRSLAHRESAELPILL
jgi:hypothetical protein